VLCYRHPSTQAVGACKACTREFAQIAHPILETDWPVLRRHRVSTSRIGLVPLEPDGGRLVAYLERRTLWDS
jgi:hypothetical protein